VKSLSHHEGLNENYIISCYGDQFFPNNNHNNNSNNNNKLNKNESHFLDIAYTWNEKDSATFAKTNEENTLDFKLNQVSS
jgi:hypothetical protein